MNTLLATPKYQLGQSVQTQRGHTAYVATIIADFNLDEEGLVKATYRYRLKSSPNSGGFPVFEDEIVKALT